MDGSHEDDEQVVRPDLGDCTRRRAELERDVASLEESTVHRVFTEFDGRPGITGGGTVECDHLVMERTEPTHVREVVERLIVVSFENVGYRWVRPVGLSVLNNHQTCVDRSVHGGVVVLETVPPGNGLESALTSNALLLASSLSDGVHALENDPGGSHCGIVAHNIIELELLPRIGSGGTGGTVISSDAGEAGDDQRTRDTNSGCAAACWGRGRDVRPTATGSHHDIGSRWLGFSYSLKLTNLNSILASGTLLVLQFEKMASRGWTFTINNWKEEDKNLLKGLGYRYVVYGYEIAPETGTPHIQGYVYFKDAKTFTRMKALLPRAHLEAARSSAAKNFEYCTKGGDYFEDGDMPRQGKREDLDEARGSAMESGMRVVSRFANAQQLRVAEKFLEYNEPERDWPMEIIWFWGASGTGKSREASKLAGDDCYRKDGTKWWNGYDGQHTVVWDEFRGRNHISLSNLLQLCDRYGYRVEPKNGMRQFRSKRLIFTSINHPEDCYEFGVAEPWAQLKRRITEIRCFTTDDAGAGVNSTDAKSTEEGCNTKSPSSSPVSRKVTLPPVPRLPRGPWLLGIHGGRDPGAGKEEESSDDDVPWEDAEW